MRIPAYNISSRYQITRSESYRLRMPGKVELWAASSFVLLAGVSVLITLYQLALQLCAYLEQRKVCCVLGDRMTRPPYWQLHSLPFVQRAPPPKRAKITTSQA
jgi:hypothetical protein